MNTPFADNPVYLALAFTNFPISQIIAKLCDFFTYFLRGFPKEINF
jgi:hypothetical protein